MSKDTKPLVTIITITFNLVKNKREKYFRQCLESVNQQTYPNIEHIIIDGASSDGSIKLINEYVTMGWVKLYSEADKGIYDAMNKGIKVAKGKYINFLHTDDFFQNEKAVELSVNLLEQNNADYSFANTQGIDAENDKLVDVWKGNVDKIPFGNHYCHQSMFIRRDVLVELGGFDTSFRISADSDLMTKLVALNKNYVYVPETIVSYRSGGLSNKYIQETRKEHSSAFYKHLGKKLGLNREDCSLLWNFSLLHERNLWFCFKFGQKLVRPEWKREYYKRFFGWSNIKEQTIRILPPFVQRVIRSVLRRVREARA